MGRINSDMNPGKKGFLSTQNRKHGAILALLFAGIGSAPADVVHVLPAFGNLQSATVFMLGRGTAGNSISESAYIEGEVEVAGNGKITLNSQATVDGDVYYRSNGSCRVLDAATVTGGIYWNDDPALDENALAALAASSQAFALTPNRSYASIKLIKSQSLTILGAPGETVVLSLRNFRLFGNSVLTLQGTATTTFIINVNRRFSLSGNAQIVLSGGLQWNDVLFNVQGTGSTVSIRGNATLDGILLATGRTVVLSGQSIENGEIIANRVLIGGGSHVNHPPVTSP